MPQIRLTEEALLDLLEQERPSARVELWDQPPRGVPGLHLRVGPRRMTWYLRYRLRGTHRRLRLGRYPHESLEAARDLAITAQRQVDRGLDPAYQRSDDAPPTFGEVAKHYLEVHARPTKKSWKLDADLLRLHVLGEWGDRPIDSIRRPDVLALLRRIKAKTPTSSNRTRAVLSKLWQIAVLEELAPENPVLGVPRLAVEKARTRILTDEEIVALWHWCEARGSVSSRGTLFLLLTGQRRGAIQGVRWDEIAGAWWRIPRSRMKRGNTTEDHRVFLSRQALDVIEPLRGVAEWVFPARFRGSKRPYLYDVYDTVLAARKDLGGSWTTHDLRRTAATKMRSLGTAHDVVSAILDHAEAGVTGRHYLDPVAYEHEVAAALQGLGDEIEGLVRGAGGVVRPFRH